MNGSAGDPPNFKFFVPVVVQAYTMRTFTKSHIMLLKVVYISLLPVLQPQEIRSLPEVVGYLGHDVALPCQFIPGPNEDKIEYINWEFQPPDGDKVSIIVSNYNHGEEASVTCLKDRVDIKEQSLIILKVEMRDAGLYTCTIAVYQSAFLQGTTLLVVQEPFSSGVISAIVISVLVLLVIMAAIGYLIFIRRCDSSARHGVYVGENKTKDTRAPVVDVIKPSVREVSSNQDVIYSDVQLRPFRDATPSSNDRDMDKARADDVTYSVVVLPRQLSEIK